MQMLKEISKNGCSRLVLYFNSPEDHFESNSRLPSVLTPTSNSLYTDNSFMTAFEATIDK